MNEEKYRGRYRIPEARWKAWDYGANGIYFVTICTHHHEHYFGEIVEGEMKFSALGCVSAECWQRIPEFFPFVILDRFVVMPNHIHALLIIDKSAEIPPVETQYLASPDPTNAPPDPTNAPLDSRNASTDPTNAPLDYTKRSVGQTKETGGIPSLRGGNQFGPQSQNLASIIRGYKTGVTLYARQNNLPFGWQARYYDRVVRNAEEHQRIREYIIRNPQNWLEDTLFDLRQIENFKEN